MISSAPRRGVPPRLMEALAAALVATVVIATRALDANAFVTWDEPAWTYRSVHFLLALARGDLRGTALTGHPGVITTWLGALGLAWHVGVTRTVDWAQLQAVGALPALDVHDGATMRQLGTLLPAAKSALPLAHAAVALAIYGLLRRRVGRGVAVAALLVLALDPYYLALSRVLHIDALAAGLMLVSALAALLSAERGTGAAQRRRYLIISGAAAGLATLTKTYGAFVAPFALALLVGGALLPHRPRPRVVPSGARDLDSLGGAPHESEDPSPPPSPRVQGEGAMDPSPPPSRRQSTGDRVQGEGAASSVVPSGARDLDSLGKALRDAALWCGLAMAAFALAWPAMWVAPIRTLNGVLGLSLEYATAPGDATTSFFRGALTDDPGAAFYPVVLLFRATPLTLVGAALAALMAAVGLVRRRRPPEAAGDHALTWGLLAYAALHLALITLSAKKFDRYMLPALLALDVVAAVGWCGALGAIRAAIGWRLPRALPAAGASSLAVVQAALLLAPLSLSRAIAYYNPWTGGLAGAAQTLPVGWGEGIEEAARYLAAQPDAERLRVATWAVAGIAPRFPGQVDKPTAASLPNADYVVVYVGDVQGETPLAAAFAGRKPDFTARVGGQPYAWVYRNAFGDALGRAIEDLATTHGAPQDAAIVLNAPSAFERQYAGAMRWGVVTGDAAEVARGLAGVISGAKDVVYVAYDGQPAHTLIRRLLARNGLLLEERPFAAAGCGATLYYYRLLPEASALRTASASIPTDATFGGELALEGYGLSSDAIEYRQELGIALRWRARTQPEHDYHASVRLVDAEGHTWGQYDAPLEDAAGSRATAWAADTEHTVDLPVSVEAGAPPGTYRALLSLYRLDDLELLAVSAGDGPPTRQLDLGPVRVRPATVPPRVDELTLPHRADLALGGGIRVLGYALSRDVVPSGEEVTVTLYWQSLEAPDADYDLLLRVAAPGAGSSADGREVGRAQARPVGDEHPTDRWRPGEVLRSAHAVRIDPDAPSGAYQVTARLVPRHGEPPSGADVALAPLAVEHVERIWEAPPIAAPLEARFGDGPDAPIALLGYDLAETEAAPGDTLHLTLYWRAVVPMDRSYTAFVHLLDGAGVVRGQRDTIPMAGERPTDGWLAGEIIVDAYAFTVAEDAPTGPHQIEIGLYDPTTGERLSVVGSTGVPIPERRLLLDRTVSVQR